MSLKIMGLLQEHLYLSLQCLVVHQLFVLSNQKFCFILKGLLSSKNTTLMGKSVEEADTSLKPRHRKRYRCETVTSSAASTGKVKTFLFFHTSVKIDNVYWSSFFGTLLVRCLRVSLYHI
jgi:hypothetical protein